MMKPNWRTAWQGHDIVVYRDEQEVDRIDALAIRKVVCLHRDGSDSPGDLVATLVRLAEEWVLLPADTGFGGRVHFERQSFWAERACIWWVADSHAPLPPRLRRGRCPMRGGEPAYARVTAGQLDTLVDGWPLEGPQTWEQRKWRRIHAGRPLANIADQRRA